MPDDPSRSARERVINVRLNDHGVQRLDELRGAWSRSEYIRRALQAAALRNVRGPRKEDW